MVEKSDNQEVGSVVRSSSSRATAAIEKFDNLTNFETPNFVCSPCQLLPEPSDRPAINRTHKQEANVNNELFSGVSFVICEDIKDVENVSAALITICRH